MDSPGQARGTNGYQSLRRYFITYFFVVSPLGHSPPGKPGEPWPSAAFGFPGLYKHLSESPKMTQCFYNLYSFRFSAYPISEGTFSEKVSERFRKKPYHYIAQ